MASGATPGQLRAGAAPDRYRGAPVSSPRTAGRLRPASFSLSSARSFAHHAPHKYKEEDDRFLDMIHREYGEGI
eukprot:2331391-Prymnesium_polylepis.1